MVLAWILSRQRTSACLGCKAAFALLVGMGTSSHLKADTKRFRLEKHTFILSNGVVTGKPGQKIKSGDQIWIFEFDDVAKKKLTSEPQGKIVVKCKGENDRCDQKCPYSEDSCSVWSLKELNIGQEDNGFVVTNLPKDAIIFEKKPVKLSSEQVERTLKQLPKIKEGLPQKFRKGKVWQIGTHYRTTDKKHEMYEFLFGVPQFKNESGNTRLEKMDAVIAIVADSKLVLQREIAIWNDLDYSMNESNWDNIWLFFNRYLSFDRGKSWYKLRFDHGSECVNWNIEAVGRGGPKGTEMGDVIESRSFCNGGGG